MDRRTLLRGGLAATGGIVTGGALIQGAPAFAASGRPLLTHGVQSGEPRATSALVWSRADRPSRLLVEVSLRPDFRGARLVRGPVVTPETDFTGRVALRDLPPGRRVFYRVRAESLDAHGRCGEAVAGELSTAPVGRHSGVRFVWTGDIAGQGWGINPDLGGMRIFDAMDRLNPDFYLCSGDTVYSDGPLTDSVALPDGRIWRNVVTAEKSKVAETLTEYRGQFAYNLLDDNLKRFAARVPQINQWDDHEVRNNWFPGQILDDARYAEKNVDVLAARARQAFFEWVPIASGEVYRSFSYGPHADVFVLDMRTYKDPNDANVYADPARGLLGEAQKKWLIDGLTRSKATWKIIANDLPLGLVVPDGANLEGVAQGDNGVPKGRELEFAEVLRTAYRRGVTGIVFLTADVHYTAAHHYDPARAAVGDFAPFWEFVSGPANAGAFGPNKLDGTFGPEAVFVHAPPAANTSPLDPAYQHFGEVDIDGRSGALTVRLRDGSGTSLWSTTLDAPV
ncbi:alkaline phosphatase D family protein [Hamadaea sp. NPDC051192]|uniref:alkaline phosphatase D family protein n=1 Tax=Hamadaea sp. NPDC051192 TaxID=3154940 RepID=UPI003445BB4E